MNDRVGQVTDGVTTTFALDVQGLPEVIYTSEGNAYLHLPGVIMAESSTGETRYLLADGLGSIRQATDNTGLVVAYNEFDPYGNPVQEGSEPYGYTGEWWESEIGLLHLRARWYSPGTGTFLSVDPVESEPPYLYVRGNVVNLTDASGYAPDCNTHQCGMAPPGWKWVQLPKDNSADEFTFSTYSTIVESNHPYNAFDPSDTALMVFRNGRYETSKYNPSNPAPIGVSNQPFRFVSREFLDGTKTEAGDIIGYGAIGNGSGYLDLWSDTDPYKGYIWVDPEAEHNFIGTSMFRATEDCARTSTGNCAIAGKTGAVIGGKKNDWKIREDMGIALNNVYVPDMPGVSGFGGQEGTLVCLESRVSNSPSDKWLILNDVGGGVPKNHIDIYAGLETKKQGNIPPNARSVVWGLALE